MESFSLVTSGGTTPHAFGAHSLAQSLTSHARVRRAQRGISPLAIACAWEHGRLIQRAGIQYLYLGRREIRSARACASDPREIDKCEGTLVLVGGGRVITLYRRDRPPRVGRRRRGTQSP